VAWSSIRPRWPSSADSRTDLLVGQPPAHFAAGLDLIAVLEGLRGSCAAPMPETCTVNVWKSMDPTQDATFWPQTVITSVALHPDQDASGALTK
jgi:hypothetical protein